jgi:hypothetical protein
MLRSKWLPLLGMLLRNNGARSGSGANRNVSESSVSGFSLMFGIGDNPVAAAQRKKKGGTEMPPPK